MSGLQTNKKYYKDSNGKRRVIGSWGRIKNGAIRSWARNKEQDILAGVEKKIGKSGHIYIFDVGDGLYKIGCTANVQQRLTALKASNPKLKLVWSAWVREMNKVEKQIHDNYKKYRLDREIFRLSRDQIFGINNLVNNIKENYH